MIDTTARVLSEFTTIGTYGRADVCVYTCGVRIHATSTSVYERQVFTHMYAHVLICTFIVILFLLHFLSAWTYHPVLTLNDCITNNQLHVLFRTLKFNRNRVYRIHVYRDRVYRITDVDGAAEALVAAKSVVIVPGYGLGEHS